MKRLSQRTVVHLCGVQNGENGTNDKKPTTTNSLQKNYLAGY